MHVAAVVALRDRLLPALGVLRATLDAKAEAFADIVKIGRTHLQDATPLTLGQELSGYVAQLDHAQRHIEGFDRAPVGARPWRHGSRLRDVNAPAGFRRGRGDGDLEPHRTPIRDGAQQVRGARHARCPGSRARIDERAGRGADEDRQRHPVCSHRGRAAASARSRFPRNEPGSSIMPGKVNPTQAEALTMAACQVMGNDVAINFGGSQGHFELNVFKPVIANAFLQSVRLLGDGMASFEEHCARGIEPNRDRIAQLLHGSLMLVTALARTSGTTNRPRSRRRRTARARGCARRRSRWATFPLRSTTSGFAPS
jgi:fumarate hydratase class II